jgi:serine acetyltransferase
LATPSRLAPTIQQRSKGGDVTSIHTPVIAQGLTLNHAEGVVIRTPVIADGLTLNHAEGVIPTPVIAQGLTRHPERVVRP